MHFLQSLPQDHRHQQPAHHQNRGRRQTSMTITTGGTSSANPSGSYAAVTGIRAITNKAPLTIRPFAAIYNPYSKGCSVLCNHPATPELKSVVKHAKQSWVLLTGYNMSALTN